MRSGSRINKRPAILLGLMAGASIAAAAPDCSVAQGQAYIDSGSYNQAIKEFTCIINNQPTAVEGYRGRIEAQLLAGQYSSAIRDHARIVAYVLPVQPDAQAALLGGYDARLAANPNSIPALTGASFAKWYLFRYPHAIQLLNQLLTVAPNNLYGTLLLGSNRVLSSSNRAQGVANLEQAIQMAPSSPDVRFIVADAYTYGISDPNRAIAEATTALNWGLDTPRIRGILAVSYLALGNTAAAAVELMAHINQVTTGYVQTAPLPPGGTFNGDLVAGRTFDIPVTVAAGQKLNVATSSHDFYDTILVLLAPDGSPITGADDTSRYFAGLDWIAPAAGTYTVRVTSFEAINTGLLTVTRK